MKKRILCIFIAVIMCMVPAAAMAEETDDAETISVAKVSGVKVSCNRNSNDVTIKWKAAAGAEKYKVYRWNGEKKKYICIMTTSRLAYVDDHLKSAKRYVYKVAAVKGSDLGEKSDKKVIYTYAGKVTGVKVTCSTISNNVRISWKKVKGASGYKVYRWSKKKGRYVLIKRTSKRSYIDKSKASKKKYKYRVAAYQSFRNESGKKVSKQGPYSKIKSVRTFGKYAGVSLARPLRNMSSCSSYGWRWGRMHYGTDLRGSTGTPIYAAADGKVIESHGTRSTMGVTIKIKHAKGVETTYGHMSRRCAFAGDRVSAGECIGYVGATGNARCSHLHFEVRIYGSTVNPMNFY